MYPFSFSFVRYQYLHLKHAIGFPIEAWGQLYMLVFFFSKSFLKCIYTGYHGVVTYLTVTSSTPFPVFTLFSINVSHRACEPATSLDKYGNPGRVTC